MRKGMLVVAVFAVGAGLGWAVLPGSAKVELRPEVVTVVDTARIEELEGEVASLEVRGDKLVSENYDLMARIEELSRAQAALSREVSEVVEAPIEVEVTEEEMPDPEDVAARAEERERRRAQAREWMGRADERTREMFDQLVAAMDDPAAAERLDALMEWREYQRELGREMRGVESDEERSALFGEMRDARQNAQQILTDQQDSLLNSFAEGQGIKDQEAFTRQLREVLQNPFFEMERTLVGGGGPPGRRGGGWPGGGGRPGGRGRGGN